jgi:hypothetical protein
MSLLRYDPLWRRETAETFGAGAELQLFTRG